uniref:Uncharacterized protein n=1 Tax=Rhizophora mucronata TaxID=61149 RepID=A0A2P2QAN8_RHIMU
MSLVLPFSSRTKFSLTNP